MDEGRKRKGKSASMKREKEVRWRNGGKQGGRREEGKDGSIEDGRE